jgi:hypothetical protein
MEGLGGLAVTQDTQEGGAATSSLLCLFFFRLLAVVAVKAVMAQHFRDMRGAMAVEQLDLPQVPRHTVLVAAEEHKVRAAQAVLCQG